MKITEKLAMAKNDRNRYRDTLPEPPQRIQDERRQEVKLHVYHQVPAVPEAMFSRIHVIGDVKQCRPPPIPAQFDVMIIDCFPHRTVGNVNVNSDDEDDSGK